jgi:hypothetical protein
VAGKERGGVGEGTALRLWGGTGALAMNSEEAWYDGGAVRVDSTLLKEGSDTDLMLIFEGGLFCAWTAVSGLDGENEGACFPLDRLHQYILNISSPKRRYHTLNSAAELCWPSQTGTTSPCRPCKNATVRINLSTSC